MVFGKLMRKMLEVFQAEFVVFSSNFHSLCSFCITLHSAVVEVAVEMEVVEEEVAALLAFVVQREKVVEVTVALFVNFVFSISNYFSCNHCRTKDWKVLVVDTCSCNHILMVLHCNVGADSSDDASPEVERLNSTLS